MSLLDAKEGGAGVPMATARLLFQVPTRVGRPGLGGGVTYVYARSWAELRATHLIKAMQAPVLSDA